MIKQTELQYKKLCPFFFKSIPTTSHSPRQNNLVSDRPTKPRKYGAFWLVIKTYLPRGKQDSELSNLFITMFMLKFLSI